MITEMIGVWVITVLEDNGARTTLDVCFSTYKEAASYAERANFPSFTIKVATR
ncbi:hypothetical protein [Alkalihalobacillus sp. CinArs1]|uniref:hypothetical protein n=1 Tax=Alkalihalobacillus sp. CinArs1 TaxID=2995314 RepID=UPI0022DD2678|nr:hypothetical protein [Alkalihalobacillus sp. CinArs1]